jgi:phage terminase Nu1 subunit (DNA packaging protein)
MTRQPARSANRPTRPEMAKAAEERARWAREQADFVALKNRRLRGELLDASAVQASWSAILTKLRSRLFAIPSRMTTLERADLESLDAEIRTALGELAEDAEHEASHTHP